jgi:hypothetical protein
MQQFTSKFVVKAEKIDGALKQFRAILGIRHTNLLGV